MVKRRTKRRTNRKSRRSIKRSIKRDLEKSLRKTIEASIKKSLGKITKRNKKRKKRKTKRKKLQRGGEQSDFLLLVKEFDKINTPEGKSIRDVMYPPKLRGGQAQKFKTKANILTEMEKAITAYYTTVKNGGDIASVPSGELSKDDIKAVLNLIFQVGSNSRKFRHIGEPEEFDISDINNGEFMLRNIFIDTLSDTLTGKLSELQAAAAAASAAPAPAPPPPPAAAAPAAAAALSAVTNSKFDVVPNRLFNSSFNTVPSSPP